MDKRYQVFISSTYLDLREERQAVSQALLRSDCFPAQMENWPAMDAEQMEAIKQIIDESDYYLVISAGKYGSISPETGVSYTEMEYDYAVEIGKPIIRLLHKDPLNALRGDQIESDAEVRGKLEAFHTRLRTGAVCKFWENPDQLESATILALLDIKKRKPAIGWVPGDMAMSADVAKELNRLRMLEGKTKKSPSETVLNFDDLTGESEVDVKVQAGDLEAEEAVHSQISLPNKAIAEAVFLALLENRRLGEICYTASNSATSNSVFSEEVKQFDHYWTAINQSTVKSCLLYLETRGLVSYQKGQSYSIPDEWKITVKGRAHAVFIKAAKEFH